jgi:hypothetical protein
MWGVNNPSTFLNDLQKDLAIEHRNN